MAKDFIPTNESNNRKRISVRIPESMYKDMLAVFLRDGVSARNLSTWVSDAIIKLKSQKNFIEIIEEEWIDKGNNISRPISLTPEAANIFSEIYGIYCKQAKGSVEIKSKIVRTAITQRLILEDRNYVKQH